MASASSGARMTRAEFEHLFERVRTWGRWGSGDQRGALNFITAERVRSATALVRSGSSVGLGLPINTVAGPDNPRPALHYMSMLGDAGSGEPAFYCDFLGIDFHGDCQSHIDALCHCAFQGRLYNGVPAREITSGGAPRLGIEVASAGIVSRGVLLDIPRLRGVRWLEPGEAVLPRELDAAEQAAGTRVGPGDILLLRSGHHRRRLELGPWDAARARAGLHPSAALWLHERQVAVLGADGDGDTVPSPVDGVAMPLHALLIAAMGVLLLDNLDLEGLAATCEAEGRWEFLCLVAPLALPGGTGSPVNPIAVF